MSGASELFIQPCGLAPGPVAAGAWSRGIPLPGVGAGLVAGMPPPIAGIPTCRDLISASPPTVLEAYEIYSYTIGWGVYLFNPGGQAFAAAPNVDVELAFLVNDRVQYLSLESEDTVLFANNAAFASAVWIADLVNPVVIGGRDRLSLRVACRADQPTTANTLVFVGLQVGPGAGNPVTPFESTIRYRVLDLPGSRRI